MNEIPATNKFNNKAFVLIESGAKENNAINAK